MEYRRPSRVAGIYWESVRLLSLAGTSSLPAHQFPIPSYEFGADVL
jgi:hypothetical protein